ncbi:MAG: c-type cytochrome, partial [Thermoguttaceae bacterium]
AKASSIALGPTPELRPEQRGQMHWNDANLCFQKWHSCASCHPDARVDALNWDLLNDGMGNPKNAKSMLHSIDTPPAMWEGVRKSAEFAVRTGFQYILFAVPDEPKCLEIEAYIRSLKPLESPLLVDGKLSERAIRGKAIFEDAKIGCSKCHPAPLYTDQKMHDVNSKVFFDRKSNFDTPSLIEVWRTAPYLHDGRYTKMKDVFKQGKHGDVDGGTASLTDEQLDDLVEFIMSL